jgi:hypothetical protein
MVFPYLKGFHIIKCGLFYIVFGSIVVFYSNLWYLTTRKGKGEPDGAGTASKLHYESKN